MDSITKNTYPTLRRSIPETRISMPSTSIHAQSKKRPSLLVDYSCLAGAKASSANTEDNLSNLVTLGRRRSSANRRPPLNKPTVQSSDASSRGDIAAARRSNTERMMRILDQATISADKLCQDMMNNDEESTCSGTPRDTEITFCVKRNSLTIDEEGEETPELGNDSDYSNSLSLSGTHRTDNLSARRSEGGMTRRSYHSLLDTNTVHSTFLPASSRHGSGSFNQKGSKRSQSLKNLVGNHQEGASHKLNLSSLVSSFQNQTPEARKEPEATSATKQPETTRQKSSSKEVEVTANFHDGFSDLSSPRKTKTCRDLSKTCHGTTFPQEISAGSSSPATDRRARRRQQQQPLLPRQRSFKDLKKASKAANRPSLTRQESFTTKQSEFAALEALIGKTRTSPIGNKKPRKLTRSLSLEGSGFTPSSPTKNHKKTPGMVERRAIGLVSPTSRPLPSPGSMRRSRTAQTPTETRRRMLLQTSTNRKLMQRQGSMRNLLRASRDDLGSCRTEHIPLSSSTSSTRGDRRAHMLRQGSFAAGSRIRTWN